MATGALNTQKTHLGLELNRFAQQKVLTAIRSLGKALPCHVTAVAGQIVTVAFDVVVSSPQSGQFTLPQVQMPIATSIYDWIPVQVGDKGTTKPNDAYINGVSGIGNLTTPPNALVEPGNLSALEFIPTANTAWVPASGNANDRIIQSPDGMAWIACRNGGTILMSTGDCVVQITAAGLQQTVSGVYTTLGHHAHTEVQSGDDDSGPPVGDT